MLTTTLTRIRAHKPCASTLRILMRHLGPGWDDDAPIPLSVVLDVCGLDDAVWCLRAADGGADVAATFAADAATAAARAAGVDAATAATGADHAAAAAARTASYASHAAGNAFYAARAFRAAGDAAGEACAAGAASYAAYTASYAAAAAVRDFIAERRRQTDCLRTLIA